MCVYGLDYYVIDGVRHDAYLYIRYVNGAGPQPGWLEMIARYAAICSVGGSIAFALLHAPRPKS